MSAKFISRFLHGGNMLLQPVSLRGRRFLIQFYEVMAEFGNVIPWLDGMDEMRFATNGEWFRDELLRRLGQHDGQVTPYQFVDGDAPRTFVGGILHFSESPEYLLDTRNAELAEQLVSEGSSFISCLQVRDPRRGTGVGTQMTQRAINAILKRHSDVWGVVSDPRLLAWYQTLGASTPSTLENNDGLWIVSWNAQTAAS